MLRMKGKLLSILFAVILLTIFLSGCNEQKSTNNIENDSAKFIGTWKYPLMSGTSGLYWTFNNNGTIKEESFVLGNTSINWGTYNIENNKICFKSQFIVHLPEGASTTCYSYQFSDDGQMLNLTEDNGVTTILTRFEPLTVNLLNVNFTYSPDNKITNQTDVMFNGSYRLSFMSGLTFYVIYDWDFGDGTSIRVYDNSSIIHRYDVSGTYPVKLTVIYYRQPNAGNFTGYKEKNLIVEN